MGLRSSILIIPRRAPHLPLEAARRCGRFDEEMFRKRGYEELRETMYLRSYPSAIRQNFPYLAQTVMRASVYSTPDRSPETSFYCVQTVVRKLFSPGDRGVSPDVDGAASLNGDSAAPEAASRCLEARRREP